MWLTEAQRCLSAGSVRLVVSAGLGLKFIFKQGGRINHCPTSQGCIHRGGPGGTLPCESIISTPPLWLVRRWRAWKALIWTISALQRKVHIDQIHIGCCAPTTTIPCWCGSYCTKQQSTGGSYQLRKTASTWACMRAPKGWMEVNPAGEHACQRASAGRRRRSIASYCRIRSLKIAHAVALSRGTSTILLSKEP